MLEVLLFWLGTSTASLGIAIATELKMMKDISDSGYKIDLEALKEYKKKNNSKNKLSYYFIPLFNLLYSLNNSMIYNNNRNFLLIDQLRIAGVIERMSIKEQEEYEKNPTGLNAYKQLMKNEIEKRKANIEVTINDEGKFICRVDDKEKKLVIVSALGKIANLSREEQEELLDETLKSIAKELNKVQSAQTEKPIEPETSKPLTTKEQIEELKQMREDLVNEFKNTNSNQEEYNFQKKK